jgi:AcrR family transcriptional regulator
MGVQERRERERSQVRTAILDAARRISERDGWAKLTIRAIAAEIEYSPALIYGYFESKEAVLVELLREGFATLHEQLLQASADHTTADVTVTMVGKAYWRFAFENPISYQLMHGLAGVPFGMTDAPAEVRACFAAFHDPIAALLEERGGNRGEESEEQTELFWASLHGLISLTMNHRIKDGIKRANNLAERLIADFVKNCQSAPVVPTKCTLS